MGFFDFIGDVFSWVGEKITDAVDWVGDKVEDVVYFFDGLRSSTGQTSTASARKVSKAGAFDSENATIEEIKAMNKILDEIKEEYKTKLKQYEEKYIELSREIKDNIVDMVETEFNLKSKYDNAFIEAYEKKSNKKFESLDINVGDIESKFNQTINDFKRTFSSEILDHIAIGDTRCAEILKLENKKDRKDKIKKYFDELVDNALNSFCYSIDKIAENSLDSIQGNINRVMKNNEESIKNIEKEIEENMKLSENEIEEKRKEYNKKEEIINSLLEAIKL